MLDELGHVPKPADHFHWNGYRFEVVDMDNYRIDRVLVSRAAPPPPHA
ncbi:transporter associated domain-containing protein [Massilia eurypsychrophila]|nr:transporter associated domain-containing protein [Massilia eurypsychrophila]